MSGDDPIVLTLADAREVLRKITSGPSCIAMGWEFEVRTALTPVPEDADMRESPLLSLAGMHVRASFQRPDRDTGAIDRGFGRWWFVPRDTTVSGLVKTCYAAIRMNAEHELLEAFLFDGVRLFDPHHTVADLARAALHRQGHDAPALEELRFIRSYLGVSGQDADLAFIARRITLVLQGKDPSPEVSETARAIRAGDVIDGPISVVAMGITPNDQPMRRPPTIDELLADVENMRHRVAVFLRANREANFAAGVPVSNVAASNLRTALARVLLEAVS